MRRQPLRSPVCSLAQRGLRFCPLLLLALCLGLLAGAGPWPAGAVEPDWIFNTGTPMLSSPKFADLTGDGDPELLVSTYAPPPDVYDHGWVHVFDRNGLPLPGWPFFTDYGPFAANVCVGNIDPTGGIEVLAPDWSRLHLLDASGNELPGWPLAIGCNYTPALEDLDGDGDLEMIVPSGYSIHALVAEFDELPGWPVSAPETIGAPAVGDLDGDGEAEIVAGTLQGAVGPDPFEVYVWELDGSVKPGFPKMTSGTVKAPPAIGDIDRDGDYEIVVPAYHTSNNDFLYVWDAEGNTEPGWPQRAGRCRLSAPALANIDADDDLEIIIGSGRADPPFASMIYAFEPSGDAVPGFPIEISVGAQINSGPIVIDLDGDPSLMEIVVKVQDYIYAYHADATLVDGFPYPLPDFGHTGTTSPTPAMADMDGDLLPELAVCSCFDRVDLLSFENPVDFSLAQWPTMKRDAENRSFVGSDASWVPPPSEGDIAWIGAGVLQNRPNPFRAGGGTWIPVQPEASRAGGAAAQAFCVEVLDTQGRLVRRLAASAVGARSGVSWDGRDFRGLPVPAGLYLYRLAGDASGGAMRMQVVR